MKKVLYAFIGIVVVVAASIGLLFSTFTAAKLVLADVAVGELPKASPPAEMTIIALPTGMMESRAAFAFRGGAYDDVRQFSMTAVLVHHPKGELIIDTGFGKNVDEHVKLLPRMMQSMTTYSKLAPVGEQLAANGVSPAKLAGVVLTHAHWDHVSGLDSLPNVPVWLDKAEVDFMAQGTSNTELLNTMQGVNYKTYDFDGGPYLGFPRSRDVWGDGSVVIVPSPGHTPGSVVVFVALPSGARYAFLGDLVWQMDGIEIPAERPWLLRRMIGENDAEVRENIARIVAVHKKFPDIKLMPAHDARAFATLPVFPGSER